MKSLSKQKRTLLIPVLAATLGLTAFNVRQLRNRSPCALTISRFSPKTTQRECCTFPRKKVRPVEHALSSLIPCRLHAQEWGHAELRFTGWDQGARQPCQGRQRVTAWAGNPFTRSTGSRRGSDCGRTEKVSHEANHTQDRADCNGAMPSLRPYAFFGCGWLAFIRVRTR